jgi:methylamine dehydrogenase heavy chain
MRLRATVTLPAAAAAASLAVIVAFAPPAAADLAPEKTGTVVELPARPGPHWFWISDVLLHRTSLYDGDDGRLLGTINSGSAGTGFVIFPLFSPAHDEIYIAETYWSRGIRGDRTDVVTVYDAKTLRPKAEIPIPAKRGEYFPGNAANALSDDGRFMAVFNITPATSLSIVDVKERRFVEEVESPGCSLAYAAGPRRFFMLCANGSALVIDLDDAGHVAKAARSDVFFDAAKDPVTEKAVRRGNQWIFVSYEGVIHTIDVGEPQLAFGQAWPLLDDSDRKDRWRVGGLQSLAVHSASGRLYALMHQGPPGTHKDPGTEIWVYDLAQKKRVQRIAVPNPNVSFLADQAKMGSVESEGFGARATRALLGMVLPNPGVERMIVTQGDKPLLVTSSGFPPTITIHDAQTGEVRHEVSEPGLGFSLLFTP